MSNSKQQREFSDLADIGPLLNEFRVRSLFLVVDRVACEAAEVFPQLAPCFNGREVVEFDRFVENPILQEICSGVAEYRKGQADMILAIGGGTALDVAKLIRCFAHQKDDPVEIIANQNRINQSSACPLVAIPTTAGTGSEATHFAVVYVEGVKHSVAHESILPGIAIVDSKLTHSMPSRLTAVTGLDALCQAIESMWSVNSTDESMCFARESLGLVVDNLHSAVHQPTCSSRANMSRAANLAGKAINISKTTAPHAVSYFMTINHGVPHGQAVALTLAPFLSFNSHVSHLDVVDRRGVGHVYNVLEQIAQTLGCRNIDQTRDAIGSLIDSIGCETRLSGVGITTKSQRDLIAKSVNTVRLSNNPRAVTEKAIREILDSIR